MNPLMNFGTNPTFTNGNLIVSAASAWTGAIGTIGFTKGKWYWEAKFTGTVVNSFNGVWQENTSLTSPYHNQTGVTAYYNGGSIMTNGVQSPTGLATFLTSDVLGMAIDMDNKYISVYKNGVALVTNAALSTSSTLVFPFVSHYESGQELNFGNAPYSVTGGFTDAAGFGNFSYAVPAGYYSLNTKNLANFG